MEMGRLVNKDAKTFKAPIPISRSMYRHQPLPPGSWIRLLRLEPGEYGDPIRCSLYAAQLQDVSGLFDALSYVWGPSDPSHVIEVDGADFVIRYNLFSFLRRLRSELSTPRGPLDMWALGLSNRR